MERLKLSPDNQFNGMLREDFKQMLISMGFEVEDCEGAGHISYEEDEGEELFLGNSKACICNYNAIAQYGDLCNSFRFESGIDRPLTAPFAA